MKTSPRVDLGRRSAGLAWCGAVSYAGPAVTAASAPGLARLDAHFAPSAVVRGIATFGSVPTQANVDALRALGLVVQPMKHLPLALVRGPVASMETVTSGVADDVYPDDRIQLYDKASADAMGRSRVPTATPGRGITVAVVDSGCDASHPDLADHVVHNVKLYSAEYANVTPDSSNTIMALRAA